MLFNKNDLVSKKFQISPRICHGGELLSIWIDAYGKSPATHLWDIAIARAFSNRDEIEAAIIAESKRTGCDRIVAAKNIVLRAGIYDLTDQAERKESIEVNEETASSLRSAADREGVSLEDYLKKIAQS